MKKTVFSLFLTGSLLLGMHTVDAQVYKIGEGVYFPGGVSNNSVVSIMQGKDMYKWDTTSGLVNIGTLAVGTSLSGNICITNDGSKIAGSFTNPVNSLNEMSIYDVGSQTWQNLGSIAATGSGTDLSSSWGMSGDGSIIVGLGWINAGKAHAVKWDAANGMVDLGAVLATRSSRANAISNNKEIIVGWQDQADGFRSGVKWVNGIVQYIKDNDNNLVGEAVGVSDDGKIIAGGNQGLPYVWNETTGFQKITHPNASPFFKGAATGISGDGKTVVGYFRPNGPPFGGEGYIWTEATGRINLNDYVTSLGLSTEGLTFSLPLAISQDGKKIVGTGVKTGTFQAVAFLIDLTSTLATQNWSKTQITIAPNPVKESLTIFGGKIDSVEIYSLTGQKMKDLKIVNGKADVSYLSKGVYILKVVAEGKKQNIKFIKE
ncbi:T9SS type A sorting domain-containing protein [Kaistella jeonii]|uniref:Secretion system C-terminal sorting domain-containing protein n=1 Tax=Kaistella jeonii TaxID=266749 RepID=A0A0C1FBX5_9FLAO|nr:T9SS type A sorting domain-containing protein [Kaistella jeonii]KIA89373.1 hypothetical protein OA86_07210 [Kaistella jeonii]SFC04023.1 Por secretion system C-terminal sorting domain-containing protein [Kaistella jeonii]VEI96698.1 Por secretion system C-terminal sorting domain [Kaistella jeonii]